MLPPETEERLSAYADGELSGDEEKLAAALVETDPEAKAFFQSILHLREQFSLLPKFSLDAEWTRQVLERLDAGDRGTNSADAGPADRVLNDRVWNDTILKSSTSADAERESSVSAHSRTAGMTENVWNKLSNVRIWAYPLSALTIMLLLIPLFSAHFQRTRPSFETARLVSPLPEVSSADEALNLSEGGDKSEDRPADRGDTEQIAFSGGTEAVESGTESAGEPGAKLDFLPDADSEFAANEASGFDDSRFEREQDWRTAPMPMAGGADSLPSRPVRTLRLSVLPENLNRLELVLQRTAAEEKIDSLIERRADSAVLIEMTVTADQEQALRKSIGSLDFKDEDGSFSKVPAEETSEKYLLRWEIRLLNPAD